MAEVMENPQVGAQAPAPIVPFPLAPLAPEERDEKFRQLTEVARWLDTILKESGQFVELGKDPRTGKIAVHVKLDGWEIIAKFLNVRGFIEDVKLIELTDGSQLWRAKAVVKNHRDEIIATGEGICEKGEMVERRDGRLVPRFTTHHSANAMACTRALRIAYRNALRVVLTLAGYEAKETVGDEDEHTPVVAREEGEVDPEKEYLKMLGISPYVAKILRLRLKEKGVEDGEGFRAFIRQCMVKGIKTLAGVEKEIEKMSGRAEEKHDVDPFEGEEVVEDEGSED
jgi:hypothetical protein